MGKTQKFKTDIAFFTIQDLSSEDVIKVIFIAEDFSGCVYERLIDVTYLEELSPIFILDSKLIFDLIQSHPTTTFDKDSILCKYKYKVLDKEKEITFPIEPKRYQSLDSETIDLKKSVQCLNIQLRTLTIVMEKLFTSTIPHTYLSVFTRSDLEAMSFYGLLTIINHIGTTFLHEAINRCYTLEVVDKLLFNVDILDINGYPPLYIYNVDYYGNVNPSKVNKIDWKYHHWKKQYDVTLQIVKAGCDLNYCHPKATDSKETLFLTQLTKNFPSGFDDKDYEYIEAYVKLMKEMLKHGANVKGLTFRYSDSPFEGRYYPDGGSRNMLLYKDLVNELISHGAIFT
jgi:hypothetical protein